MAAPYITGAEELSLLEPSAEGAREFVAVDVVGLDAGVRAGEEGKTEEFVREELEAGVGVEEGREGGDSIEPEGVEAGGGDSVDPGGFGRGGGGRDGLKLPGDGGD